MKRNLKLILTLVMVLSLALAGSAIGFADDPTMSNTNLEGAGVASGSVEDARLNTAIDIQGTIDPLAISVTHPINLTWAINPNTVGNEFAAAAWSITNNSRVVINMEIVKFVVDTAGWIDVPANTYTAAGWLALDAADSQSKIALSVARDESAYAREAADIADSTSFGTLAADDGMATLRFAAKHGLAFKSTETVDHELELRFTLN